MELEAPAARGIQPGVSEDAQWAVNAEHRAGCRESRPPLRAVAEVVPVGHCRSSPYMSSTLHL